MLGTFRGKHRIFSDVTAVSHGTPIHQSKQAAVLRLFKSKVGVAKDEYSDCQKHREKRLLGFRQDAAGEIRLMYPDAAILMGTTFDEFLFYSRTADVLVPGAFNDRMFPSLAHVQDDGSAEQYQAAVSDYLKRISAYGPDTPYHLRSLLEDPDRYFLRLNPDARRELFTKGYWFYPTLKGDMIIAAEVCINDVRVASSSCLNPRTSAYYVQAIYNSVLSRKVPSQNGISAISLSLVIFDYCSISTRYYERLYDDNTRFAGSSGLKLFNANFGGLIDFIRAIESTVNAWPMELANEKECWEDLMPGFVEGY